MDLWEEEARTRTPFKPKPHVELILELLDYYNCPMFEFRSEAKGTVNRGMSGVLFWIFCSFWTLALGW